MKQTKRAKQVKGFKGGEASKRGKERKDGKGFKGGKGSKWVTGLSFRPRNFCESRISTEGGENAYPLGTPFLPDPLII